MERNNSSPKFESDNDDTKDKDGTTKPAKRVPRVPLDEELHAVERQLHEQARQGEEQTEEKKGKKKKRKKRKKQSEEAKEEPAEKAKPADKKPEEVGAAKEPEAKSNKKAEPKEAKEAPKAAKKESEAEDKTEGEEAEEAETKTETEEKGEVIEEAKAEHTETEPKPDDEYKGWLPISRRAKEEYRQRMQKLAEAAAAEEPGAESQEKPEEVREIALQETDAETSASEAVEAADEAAEEEQPDKPVQASTQAQSRGTRANTQAASPNPTPPSTAPASRPAASNASGRGGSGAAVPPVGAGSFWPPNNPNYHQQTHPDAAPATPDVAPANPNAAPAAPSSAEHAYSRARERRSLVAGLIVGGLIEHFRHKRRENRQDKEHKKEVSKLKTEHHDDRIRHEAGKRDSERRTTALEKRLARLKSDAKEAVPAAAAAFERSAEQTADKMANAPAAEKQPAQKRPEQHEGKPGESPEIRAAREKLEEVLRAEAAQEEADEQAELPDDRFLEQSAWHRIEVDKKTGHAVEQPAVEYGKEFKHEQHQEQLHNESGADGQLGADTAYQTQTFPGAQNKNAGNTSSASTAAGQKQKKGKGNSPFGQGINVNASALTDIVLWVILGIIIIAIISTLSS